MLWWSLGSDKMIKVNEGGDLSRMIGKVQYS